MQSSSLLLGYFLAVACLLAGPALRAQYAGGPGDGSDGGGALQLNLSGTPVGLRPLYAGGSGDGFDHRNYSAVLNGAAAAGLYGGGPGDGHDVQQAPFSLSGQDLGFLYGGGPGDGFDRYATAFALDGASLAGLFGGGAGDGFDRYTAAAALDGASLAAIFGGGPGDGFDGLAYAGAIGMPMTMLFGGGVGDGFDQHAFQAGLDGLLLTQLFGGGPGDGFDRATYEGAVPLPLLLLSFDAFPEDTYVLLRWVTENEVATDFFTIEKTRDGRDFQWVGNLAAAGYSEPDERLHYELRDPQPFRGQSFYRLKTTDFDGAISLSHLVAVHFAATDTDWDFVLFPNPNTGRHFDVRPRDLSAGSVLRVELFDAAGRRLTSDQLTHQPGRAHRIELPHRLPAGSYLIRGQHPDGSTRSKILIVGR